MKETATTTSDAHDLPHAGHGRKARTKLTKKAARQRADTARKRAKKTVRDHDAIGATKAAPIETDRKHGRDIRLVNPAHTTMDCAHCMTRAKHALPPGERTYTCTACGTASPRGKNSAHVTLTRAGRPNPAGTEGGRLPGAPLQEAARARNPPPLNGGEDPTRAAPASRPPARAEGTDASSRVTLPAPVTAPISRASAAGPCPCGGVPAPRADGTPPPACPPPPRSSGTEREHLPRYEDRPLQRGHSRVDPARGADALRPVRSRQHPCRRARTARVRGRRRAPRDHRHDAGRARLPRHDPREPAPGPARPGPARPGPARPGPARPDATQADPREAASSARLLDWIDSLPDGWVTMLGGGAALSGGRRGRLLLARALLANPPVLVLDEPTEGLDPDAAVLADILDATRGRTTLLVTHERSGLAAADRVVTLDRGRIRPVPECTR